MLALVVSYSDTDTLAKWMRVSSEYNELAAPILYEFVTLDYVDRVPFSATTENILRKPINRQEVGGKDEQTSEGQGHYD